MSTLRKSIFLILTVFSSISANAICYIANNAGVGAALQGEPVLSFYITPTGIQMPTAYNNVTQMSDMMTALLMAQVPDISSAYQMLFTQKEIDGNTVTVPSTGSFNLLLQFPDMRNMIEEGVGMYITQQRYMCTFDTLLLNNENYSTRYYLSNLEPARLLFLTPDGLSTINIADDDAVRLKNAINPWLPASLTDLFDADGCTQDEVTVYAVLPDLYKTTGKNSGYYRLTFVPDNSNLPAVLGGDGKKNGWYYLSDMKHISDVPPFTYNGSWGWSGDDVTPESAMLAALPAPYTYGGMTLMDVTTDLSAYLPGMTPGCYMLQFNPDNHQLVSYTAVLSKALDKLTGFPSGNDINSIFDSSTGVPLMDALLIFEDNIAKVYFNMSGQGIPAYAAQNGYIYDYHENFFTPMTVSRIKSLKSQLGLDAYAPKLYITGSGSNMYSGGTDSEGLVFIKGDENDSLHIYIENFTVNSMADTPWDMTFGSVMGNISVDKMLYMLKGKNNNVFDLLGQGSGSKYTRGASSVLAFGSKSVDTAKPFKVCIHSKGVNTLTGGAQSYFTQYSMDYLNNNAVANCIVSTLLGLEIDVLVNIFAKGITRMVASPVSVRPYSYTHDPSDDGMVMEDILQSATRLRFDDYWPTDANGTFARTNGMLNLPVDYDTSAGECEYDHSAPSIDYGTAASQVIFDGGQYTLTTAAKTSTALSTGSHAIANRAVDFSVNMKLLGSINIDANVKLPNTGTSIGRDEDKDANAVVTNVIIENGTFNTYSAEGFKTYYDVVSNGQYYSYTDLRLPYNTDINGGSFNCDAYRVSDATQRGLVPIYRPTDSDTIALCRQDVLYSKLDPDKTDTVLTDVESGKGNLYTYSYHVDGVKKDTKDSVHLYLPCSNQDVDMSDSFTQNYTTLFPLLGVSGLMEVGGPVEVYNTYKGLAAGIPVKNAYLMQYVPNMETINNAKLTIGGINYSMKDVMPAATREADRWAGTVSNNTGTYKIEYGMYMMRSFTGNRWYMFSPPYDVSKVYVVETTDAVYSAGTNPADTAKTEYRTYLDSQAASESDMLDAIFNQLVPDVTNADAAGSGPLLDFVSFLRNIDGVSVTELTHYNPNIEGHKAAQAHYYLYHDTGDEESLFGEWPVQQEIESYRDFWEFADYSSSNTTYINQDNEELPDSEQKYLMAKDEIYAFFLPEGKDRYWDNKYLLFVGYGPQTLNSTAAHEDYLNEDKATDEFGEGYIQFQGNNTLANYNVSVSSGYLWQLSKNAQNMYTFSAMQDGDMVHPGEVYAIAESVTAPTAMPRWNYAVSGEEQVPHADEIKLLAWEQNGIAIQSLCRQDAEIFSADGRSLWKGHLEDGSITHVSLTSGVYIIRSEGQTTKIIVR
ncbi:MAG: hypothetical protein IJ776_01540 [Paludibacteraceae bacterium]|nr:hypothetical protein [Paludibacteraceae bacterium]